MARIRTVKPDYPKHPKVRRVSRDARLLNIHLWNLADDEGRLQELPNAILGAVFPTDEDVTPVLVREWLGELQNAGLIVRYEVAGEAYIQCHDFLDHQVINKPKPSVLPSPEAKSATSLPNPVVVPDSSREEGKGREGNRKRKQKASGRPSEFDSWLKHYQETTGKQARGSKPARDAFNARVKEGRTLDDLKAATVGCHGNEFCRTNGHDVPETILRASKVERYIQLGRQSSRKTDKYAGVTKQVAA